MLMRRSVKAPSRKGPVVKNQFLSPLNLFVACGIALLSACGSGMDSEVPEGSGESEQGLVTLPIHGADTWWAYSGNPALKSVDQHFRLDDSAPYMYWSHYAKTDTGQMYVG